MNQRLRSAPVGLAPMLGVALLVLGVAVDLGFTRRHYDDVRRLVGERAQLRQKLSALESRDLDSQRLASYFGIERLTDLLDPNRTADPVDFVVEAVAAAGLTRLELGTVADSEVDQLQRTQLFLRVSGRYEQLWRFVNRVERGSRLVTVDALAIGSVVESDQMEARLNLSVYDPLEGQ